MYVEIRLSEGGSIEGTVRLGGRPAANQQVFCHSSSGGQSQNTTTDGNGYYLISGLGEGDYNVSGMVQQPGGGARNGFQQVTVQTGMVSTANFDFTPGDAVIEGTVTIAGQPIAEGHVAAIVSVGESTEQVSTQIGVNGAYLIEGVPAGMVNLNVGARSGDAWLNRSVQVEAVSGRTVRRDIDLNAGVRVVGTVSGAKQGDTVILLALRGGIEITAISEDLWISLRDSIAGQAQIAADGSFEMAGLEPGTYTFVAVAIGNPREGRVTIENAPFATVVTNVASDDTAIVLRLPN